MYKEKVLKHLFDSIRITVRQMKREKASTPEQMKQLSAVSNSYCRLLSIAEGLDGAEIDPAIEGSSTYYDEMVGNQP